MEKLYWAGSAPRGILAGVYVGITMESRKIRFFPFFGFTANRSVCVFFSFCVSTFASLEEKKLYSILLVSTNGFYTMCAFHWIPMVSVLRRE